MARAVFGDFARAVESHLDVPAGTAVRGGSGQEFAEVNGALLRITEVMARYASDVSLVSGDYLPGDRSRLAVWARAAIEAREALGHADELLRESGASPGNENKTVTGTSLPRGLHAAAASMTAARDLLQTHFTSEPGSVRQGRSEWALVITSPTVTRTLLGEIAIWARHIAPQLSDLAVARPGMRGTGEARRRMETVGHCLWSVHAAVQAAHQHDPVSADDRRLLHAIPVNMPQPRCVPDGTETIGDLCAGIISTAERVRHAAPIPPRQPAWDPGLTITSLRQVAATGTATSHHCRILLRALAARASQAGHDQSGPGLLESAAAATQARARWLHAVGAVDQVTTDVRRFVSAEATEAGDLALWTGRLAYDDPRWQLSSGPSQPARAPEALAAEPDDIPVVLAAIHHAAETLRHLARADQHQIRAAADAGRILVPTRSLPESDDVARRYSTAPPSRISQLIAAYQDAGTASAQTTAAIADLAETVRAPSRILTLARAATRPTRDSAPSFSRGSLPEPALTRSASAAPEHTTAELLRHIGATSPDLLRRGSEIDRARERLILDAAQEQALDHTHHNSARSLGPEKDALSSHPVARADPRAVAATIGQAPRQSEPPEFEP